MKLVLSIVSVCLLLGLSRGYEDKTVFQYLQDNRHPLLVNLLQQAKLDGTLSGKGPFTLFAPREAAIASLDPALLATLNQNPIQLQQVLKYHVLSGYKLIPQLNAVNTEQTVEGQSISITHATGQPLMLNTNTSIVTPNDIVCNNGVVHVIDSVMVPPVFGSENIATVLIIDDAKFQDTFLALELAELRSILEGGEYTFFAPTNYAWARFADNILHPQIHNASMIYREILKYHMVPGARFSNALHNGDKLYTIHGSPVTVNVTSMGLGIDRAHITEADIPASNGVIHAIDSLLFPLDLLTTLRELYYKEHPTVGPN